MYPFLRACCAVSLIAGFGCSSAPTDADRVIQGEVAGISVQESLINLEVTGVTDECGGMTIVHVGEQTEVRRRLSSGAVTPATAEQFSVGNTIRALPYFIAQSCPGQYSVHWVEIQP